MEKEELISVIEKEYKKGLVDLMRPGNDFISIVRFTAFLDGMSKILTSVVGEKEELKLTDDWFEEMKGKGFKNE